MEVNPQFQNMTREQIEAHIINKALQDPAFRKELLDDPKTALGKEIGLKASDDFKLQVIEETSNTMCLVLPPAQGELSDMELEAVAGGKGGNVRGISSKKFNLGGGARIEAQGGQN